jgi:glyoxylase-like metal-dependent hydrolase (beta-lactamase superfamily II)
VQEAHNSQRKEVKACKSFFFFLGGFMVKKYSLSLMGENTYFIIENNNLVIIDPGENFNNILDEALKYNIKGILLTHAHYDHIVGIKYLTKYPIYISDKELDTFLSVHDSLYEYFNSLRGYDINELNIIPLNIENGFELKLLDTPFKIYNTPGHTKGGISILYKDMLFTGDTLFRGTYGRFDFPTGNFNELKDSINFIINNFNDDIKIMPGHGEESTISFEKKYNMFFN